MLSSCELLSFSIFDLLNTAELDLEACSSIKYKELAQLKKCVHKNRSDKCRGGFFHFKTVPIAEGYPGAPFLSYRKTTLSYRTVYPLLSVLPHDPRVVKSTLLF